MIPCGIRDPDVLNVWEILEEGLLMIYTSQSLPPPHYIKLYGTVYSYCTSEVHELKAGSTIPTKMSQHDCAKGNIVLIGSDLYVLLRNFLTDCVQKITERGISLNGEDILIFFTQEWTSYRFNSKVVGGIFSYLDRHWIKREIDEGNQQVFESYPLALVVWRDILFKRMSTSVVKELLKLIKANRDGEKMNISLIKGVIDCFVELGIENKLSSEGLEKSKSNCVVTTSLLIYETFFQQQFLDATEEYFIAESNEFIQRNEFTDYMKRIELRLNEENQRCILYLHDSTKDPLADSLVKVLISNHIELFEAEFSHLLEENKDEDLGRMYNLCSRVTDGLNKLMDTFMKHIIRQGETAIMQVADTAFNDSKLYITKIVEVYKRYHRLVSRAFKCSSGFTQALDRAFSSIVNKNEITKKANNASKSPELLARYCDLLLKRNSRVIDEGELDDMLADALTVFKYIEDKDVFQKFYVKMFAKRLVNEQSISEEMESNMISKLKQICGFEYTSKLQRMFTDISISKDVSEKFKNSVQSKVPLKVEFSVMVLGAGAWPFNQGYEFELPAKLRTSIDLFSGFYQNNHSGRKLNWIFSLSRGELASHVFQRKYSFIANTAQMAILILYNDSITLTLELINSSLKLQKDILVQILQGLLKSELLLVNNGAAATVDMNTPMNTVFELNLAYSNKKLKVDLTKLMVKTEVRQDVIDIQKNVDQDRTGIIQAAIVRILKMRKKIRHNQLLTEVLAQLSPRFIPKVPMIKKNIDKLIEKEYLMRVPDEMDVYEYIS